MKHKNPLEAYCNLHKIEERFRVLSQSENTVARQIGKEIISKIDANPALRKDFATTEELQPYLIEYQDILKEVIPVSQKKTIQLAVFPNSELVLSQNLGYEEFIQTLGLSSEAFLKDLFASELPYGELLPYGLILHSLFPNEKTFQAPLSFIKKYPNPKSNSSHLVYKIQFITEFIEVNPKPNAPKIGIEEQKILISHEQSDEVWQKYFPAQSWEMKGILLINIIESHQDFYEEQISRDLLHHSSATTSKKILEDIRELMNNPNLQIGSFTIEQNKILSNRLKEFTPISWEEKSTTQYQEYHPNWVPNFENEKTFLISDVRHYEKYYGTSDLIEYLKKKGIQSIVFLPIPLNEESAYVVEIASDKANDLNAFNIKLLKDIKPYITLFAQRFAEEYRKEISLIVQEKCTAIHPSVDWKFKEAAAEYHQEQLHNEGAVFPPIQFKDVFPLYGQLDIVGSSDYRNKATQKDLLLSLNAFQNADFIKDAKELESFETLRKTIAQDWDAASEIQYQKWMDSQNQNLLEIKDWNPKMNCIYQYRKQYDTFINTINRKLAQLLEKKQKEAQKIIPHYFQLFKTDGVAHEIFTGESIQPTIEFNTEKLNELEYWQLETICEMNRLFYDLQKEEQSELEVASLVLSYPNPIDIRYRRDEQHFDIDGSYHVRYEIFKKRIDKAYLKNRKERLTQAKTLSIVFSDATTEKKYENYLKNLQKENKINSTIEILELEDLQGVKGLKAFRVRLKV